MVIKIEKHRLGVFLRMESFEVIFVSTALSSRRGCALFVRTQPPPWKIVRYLQTRVKLRGTHERITLTMLAACVCKLGIGKASFWKCARGERCTWSVKSRAALACSQALVIQTPDVVCSTHTMLSQVLTRHCDIVSAHRSVRNQLSRATAARPVTHIHHRTSLFTAVHYSKQVWGRTLALRH